MQSETARIETFSDAVFAIAITLLILEIKVPGPGQGHLTDLLLEQWPSYLAFFISFAFIGIMWLNHHRMFTHIRHCNDVLLVLNLVVLLGVSVLPFPTAVLAEHLHGADRQTAALIYNATFLFIAVSFNALWRYAVERRMLDSSVNMAVAASISRRLAIGPVVYAACLALAWFNVHGSLIANMVLSLFVMLPPRQLRKGDASPYTGS